MSMLVFMILKLINTLSILNCTSLNVFHILYEFKYIITVNTTFPYSFFLIKEVFLLFHVSRLSIGPFPMMWSMFEISFTIEPTMAEVLGWKLLQPLSTMVLARKTQNFFSVNVCLPKRVNMSLFLTFAFQWASWSTQPGHFLEFLHFFHHRQEIGLPHCVQIFTILENTLHRS